MGIKKYGPYTPSRRNMTGSDFSEITKATPEKSLVVSKDHRSRAWTHPSALQNKRLRCYSEFGVT